MIPAPRGTIAHFTLTCPDGLPPESITEPVAALDERADPSALVLEDDGTLRTVVDHAIAKGMRFDGLSTPELTDPIVHVGQPLTAPLSGVDAEGALVTVTGWAFTASGRTMAIVLEDGKPFILAESVRLDPIDHGPQEVYR